MSTSVYMLNTKRGEHKKIRDALTWSLAYEYVSTQNEGNGDVICWGVYTNPDMAKQLKK